MHVLMITSFFEPDSGAASVRLTRLAKMLVQRGHRVTVLTTLPSYPQGHIAEGYRGKWGVVENRDGVEVIRMWLWATPSPRISRKMLSQISFMFTSALRGLVLPRPDVVFIESQPVFTGFAGAFISLFKCTPYVLHVPAMWPEHLLTVGATTEKHTLYRIARSAMNTVYRGAAGIVTLSPTWVDTIQAYIGKTDKIEFIDNGVDLRLFRPNLDSTAFRQKYQLADKKLITFIGTFATQYDFDVMFQVAKNLSHRPELLFIFIGSGSQNDLVEQRISQGDLPNLRWLGLIDRAEIPSAWAASHITYLSFRNQDLYRGTIPGKFFEAMACGVPIASGLEGDGGDIIRRSGAGIPVPFADADALTDAVQRLLDNRSLYEECSRAGRAFAEQYYNPENVTSALENAMVKAMRRAKIHTEQ